MIKVKDQNIPSKHGSSWTRKSKINYKSYLEWVVFERELPGPIPLEHSYTEVVHDGRCHPKNLIVPRAEPLSKQKMPKTILPKKVSHFASHDSTTSFSLLPVSVLFCISRSFCCSSSLSCALVSFTALGLLLVDC